jgi:hypothetical protein
VKSETGRWVAKTAARAEVSAGLGPGALVDHRRITDELTGRPVFALGSGLAGRAGDAHADQPELAVDAVVADEAERTRNILGVLESPRETDPDFVGGIATEAADAPSATDASVTTRTASATDASVTTSAADASVTTGTASATDASVTTSASGSTDAARASGTASAADASNTSSATHASGTAFAACTTPAVGKLLCQDAGGIAIAAHLIDAAALHAVLPIDALRAERTTAALRRLEARIALRDGFRARGE